VIRLGHQKGAVIGYGRKRLAEGRRDPTLYRQAHARREGLLLRCEYTRAEVGIVRKLIFMTHEVVNVSSPCIQVSRMLHQLLLY
jgi:hypothetical protein